jgi:hypothetical protein
MVASSNVGREPPVVTVREFVASATCYAGSTVCYRPEADVREHYTYTAERPNGGFMLADIILNILGPISAKRYAVVRKALWVVLAVFLAFFIYGVLAS